MTAWYVSAWNDSRLSWDPEMFGGVGDLKTDASQVWIPDITVLNAAEPTQTMYPSWKSDSTYVKNKE